MLSHSHACLSIQLLPFKLKDILLNLFSTIIFSLCICSAWRVRWKYVVLVSSLTWASLLLAWVMIYSSSTSTPLTRNLILRHSWKLPWFRASVWYSELCHKLIWNCVQRGDVSGCDGLGVTLLIYCLNLLLLGCFVDLSVSSWQLLTNRCSLTNCRSLLTMVSTS